MAGGDRGALAHRIVARGWMGERELRQAEGAAAAAGCELGRWLVERNLLTREQLSALVDELDVAATRVAPPPRSSMVERLAALDVHLDDSDAFEALPSPTGQRLGRYVVGTLLGEGGMGEVFAVRDEDLARTVAAKVATGDLDPMRLRQFVREARITGQLDHPGIPPVHELGLTDTGRPYFTMRRLGGAELADRLAEPAGAGPELLARLRIFLKVCDAIAFAHSRGVIHRDLKPSNIMVGTHGEVLVLDWGLAKRLRRTPGIDETADPLAGRLAPQRPLDTPDPDAPLRTMEGTVVGTPAYMPPEQALGEIARLDERSDVYSLGAILFEILTGRPPFVRESVWDLLLDVSQGDWEPPSAVVPAGVEIPWELEAVVCRAMATDPDQRYQTVEAMHADVEAYLGGGLLSAARYGPLQRLAKWTSRHRRALLTAVTVVCSLVGWVVVEHMRARAARRGAIAAERDTARERAAAIEVVLAGWRQRQVDADERDALLGKTLAAISRIDALRAAGDDETVRALRRQAGRQLGQLALAGGDYRLARQAFADLARAGASDADISKLQAIVDRVRDEGLRRRKARLEAILEDLRQGLARPGRARDGPTLEEYVLEAVSYREAQTVAVLGEALDGLTRRARERPRWTQADHDVAELTCRVLGHLGMPASVPPLARWLAATTDDRMRVVAGTALCATRRAEALPPLLELRARLGEMSPVWEQIERGMGRLPVGAGSTLVAGAGSGSGRAAVRERIQALIFGRHFVRALEQVAQALARDPDDPELHHLHGVALDKLGRRDAAIAAYTEAIAKGGQASSLNNRALSRMARSGRGDLAGALADLNRAIEIAPGVPVYRLNRGVAHERLGDWGRAEADYDKATQLGPRSAIAFNNRGYARYRLGRLREGLADLQHALTLDPGLMRARYNRAVVHLELGDLTAAESDIDAILRIQRRAIEAYVLRARVARARGDLAAARRALDDGLRAVPDDVEARRMRARVAEDSGDVAAAFDDLDWLLKRNPQLLPALLDRARLNRLQRRWTRAERDLSAAVRQAPETRAVRLEQAMHLLDRGDARKAAAIFQAVVRADPDDSDSWADLSVALRRAGQLQAALDAIDRAVALASEVADHHYNRGLILRDGGRVRHAIEALDRAIALAPRHADALLDRALLKSRQSLTRALVDVDRAIAAAPRMLRARLVQAQLLHRGGKTPEALQALERANELAPGHLRVTLQRAEIHLDRGQRPEALAQYEAVLRVAPRQFVALHNAGVCTRHLGRPAEALRYLDRALAVNARQPLTHAERALALGALGRWADAVESWNRVLSLRADHPHARHQRGIAHRRAGNLDRAAADLDAAARRYPDDPNVAQQRALLRAERKDVAGALAELDRATRMAPNIWQLWADRARILGAAGRKAEAAKAADQARALAPPEARAAVDRRIVRED